LYTQAQAIQYEAQLAVELIRSRGFRVNWSYVHGILRPTELMIDAGVYFTSEIDVRCGLDLATSTGYDVSIAGGCALTIGPNGWITIWTTPEHVPAVAQSEGVLAHLRPISEDFAAYARQAAVQKSQVWAQVSQ
jgi:hypothetical protein